MTGRKVLIRSVLRRALLNVHRDDRSPGFAFPVFLILSIALDRDWIGPDIRDPSEVNVDFIVILRPFFKLRAVPSGNVFAVFPLLGKILPEHPSPYACPGVDLPEKLTGILREGTEETLAPVCFLPRREFLHSDAQLFYGLQRFVDLCEVFLFFRLSGLF